jgi:hypothetical protein
VLKETNWRNRKKESILEIQYIYDLAYFRLLVCFLNSKIQTN